jgi:hypothetical protein
VFFNCWFSGSFSCVDQLHLILAANLLELREVIGIITLGHTLVQDLNNLLQGLQDLNNLLLLLLHRIPYRILTSMLTKIVS